MRGKGADGEVGLWCMLEMRGKGVDREVSLGRLHCAPNEHCMEEMVGCHEGQVVWGGRGM